MCVPLISVQGCDASVLLVGPGTEQSSSANFRLRGQHLAMNLLKQAVERACPNTVSCADILAFAARDGVVLSGGPRWTVKGGRRDGVISLESDASSTLPGPDSDLSELTAAFEAQNLTQADLVHLSGAHTIGESGCVHIDSRLYSGAPDPILTLTPSFLNELRRECPKPNQPLRTVNLDRQTPRKFDTKYYENLVARKGLLTSDQVLFEDVATKQLVLDNTVESVFFANFGNSMVKLSEVGVITGTEGEIRTRCFAVNS